MKNLYALDENNNLVHIHNVKKELKQKFHCCNCGKELIAKKGRIKAHHFSHKAQDNCSYESYLHKLSKIKFYKKYSECLQKREPFYIDFKIKVTCNSCIDIKYIETKCRLKDKVQKFDLTKWFDTIAIEKGIDGFIADVLLKSTKKGDELLIEFAVTHKCNREKIDSGSKIVEIEITDERDLKFIDDKHISISNKKTSYFNFKSNHKISSIRNPESCMEKFEFFSILKDNRTSKIEKTMSRIISELKTQNFKHVELLEKKETEYSGQDFINLVREYALKDRSFKNCYSCRFSTKNNNYYAEYNLFCKRLKCVLPNSNIGSNCDKYWVMENLYQF